MRNAIDSKLDELHTTGRKGLMTHVVIGYPTLKATVPLVSAMADAGADFIELQIPFSDPLADGSVIQSACEHALVNGTRIHDAFIVARQLQRRVRTPLLLMAYFNTVYTYGVERFCRDAADAGIAGLIIPDAPLEAARREQLLPACQRYGLHNIVTTGPTSTSDRLHKNATIASGFVYCMSRQGVTGTHLGLAPDVETYLARVRQHMHVPLAVGFGISNRQRLEAVLPHCDVAVVGSAIVERITGSDVDGATRTASAFIRSLVPALAN